MNGTRPPPPLKRLGQHFLIDPHIARNIVSLATLAPTETVLEIGPGRGILTAELCRVAAHVIAIEIDSRLFEYLAERYGSNPNLHLIRGDAMTYPLEELPIGTVVVANLPYYLSTPLLFRFLEQHRRFSRMVLMLQKEVVDRVVALPGTSHYGVLSVRTQHVAMAMKLFTVSPHCFRPRPEVESAVLLLQMKKDQPLVQEDERRFASVVKAAFAHRRKTLINSLKNQGYPQEAVLTALKTLDLPLEIRAEDLSIEQFVALSHLLFP